MPPAGVDEVVPGPVAWESESSSAAGVDDAAGDGEDPEPEAFGFPAAGGLVLGRRPGSGSRRAGRRPARRSRARSGSGRSRGRAGSAARCPSGRGCGPRQRARCRCRTSRSASRQPGARGVLVAKQVIRHPLWSVSRSWAPGWGRSRRAMTRIPGGQSCGPPGRTGRRGRGRHPRGQFGDLGALTGLPVTVDRGPPRLLGNRLDRGLDGLVGGEPDRVLQPEVGDVVQERLRAAAGVGRGPAPARARARGAGPARSSRVLMWSALFHGEALPGRRSSARASPVPCSPWSTNAHIGANPKPRL